MARPNRRSLKGLRKFEITMEDAGVPYSFLSRIGSSPAHSPLNFFRTYEPGMVTLWGSFTEGPGDVAHKKVAHGKPIIAAMIRCMDSGYSREMLHNLDANG